jgi:X box-binding protein 1
MSQSIVITVPKYVSIAKTPASYKIDDSLSSAESEISEFLVRGNRKRKLDHLTWEEKVQRKKMKNREAAQTSRDRKKAKMENMEKTIEKQTKELAELNKRCERLENEKDDIEKKYKKLEEEYQKLKARMDSQEKIKAEEKIAFNNIPEEHKYNRSIEDNDDCITEIDSIKTEGSAVSQNSPQWNKSMEPNSVHQSSMPTKNQNSQALWQIIALCLLYRTCSKTSMSNDLKSLPKVCSQMSQQQWKQVIQEAAKNLPKMKAIESNCLDQWWGPTNHTWNPPKISA